MQCQRPWEWRLVRYWVGIFDNNDKNDLPLPTRAKCRSLSCHDISAAIAFQLAVAVEDDDDKRNGWVR